MAYKDAETARAAARRFREANPGYGRAQYAKHAEKRRAAKVAAYHADEESSRRSQRERYARNAATVKQQQADYRKRNRAALAQQQKAWREANPDRVALEAAKRALMVQTGVRMRDIPDDLAETKAIQLEIRRWAREQA